MTAQPPAPAFRAASAEHVFTKEARASFSANYPETPFTTQHGLTDHPLLSLDALAHLAEALPSTSIEYNRGDLPIGVTGKPGSNGLSIGETIRAVAKANSWAAIKNIEADPAYAALLGGLIGELAPAITAATGAPRHPQGFVFVSSPNAVTPYHFDPEHNLLLQIAGSKVMTQFPAGDARFAPDRVHEAYHTGGARELVWKPHFETEGRKLAITGGEALYVPVMAPHYVRNGPQPSISLSITWRSAWSYEEADARGFNHWLRARGGSAGGTRRWPRRNRGRATAFRALRRLGLTA